MADFPPDYLTALTSGKRGSTFWNVLSRLPDALLSPLSMISRFSIFLLAALTAGLLPAKEPEKPPVSFKPLANYQPLWKNSLFTTHEVKVEAAPVENADWAVNLVFSGWSELNGQRTVYLFRTDTEQSFILQENEPPEAGVMQFIEVENEDSLLEARVLVQLDGQEAWINQQPETATPPAEATYPQPTQQTVTGVQAPTTVDSRAALLRPGVILSADATFDNSLAKPEEPATGNLQQPGRPQEASRSNAEVLMRLRERHEHLYRMFPRPGR